MEIILTHENADFDAVASMLAVHKLNNEAIPILPKKLQANVQDFLTLYSNGLPFVKWDDFKQSADVKHVTITDTAKRLDVKHLPADTPTTIIEHHPLTRELQSHETWAGEIIGAATTLVVERIIDSNIHINSLEATLMALGIYADTGSFTYGGTNIRDLQAAKWLLEKGAVLDTIRRFLTKTLNQEQQELLEQFIENSDSRHINGFDVTICTSETKDIVENVNTVVGVLSDILDTDAIIVLAAMKDYIQFIGRSSQDAVDVSQLAQFWGGGGHPRAAGAAIKETSLAIVLQKTWQFLQENIQAAIRVSDIMSVGEIQTVNSNDKLTDIIGQIRRIGHEGYPVLDNGDVAGLLTLRDADKALEHGLKQSTVKDVMIGSSISLKPQDSVHALEELMVESGWGQIPIINHQNELIGIVTRTDLITHWSKKHPIKNVPSSKIDVSQMQDILGKENSHLIEKIAQEAQAQNLAMYMVGGVVRDLLLERPNFDIDFVIEGDAITFVRSLQERFGGDVHAYPPFGTATWTFDEAAAKTLDVALAAIPEHLDFASARHELYEHPTALPTVYNSSIKLDLRRRDFTINTLAVQLSPQQAMWQILDFYGGMNDLAEGVIRVLHSLSFVDDPTRILRAIRFSVRLTFEIEDRTRELMQTALPMLKRITGERIQNEINLILSEENVVDSLLQLQGLGIFNHIHPSFNITQETYTAFEHLQSNYPQWSNDNNSLKWHLLMARIPINQLAPIAQQLLLGQRKLEAITNTARLLQNPSVLENQNTKPSMIASELSGLSEETLVALWLCLDNTVARHHIEQYHDVWQHIKPNTDGNTLKQMGLKPGPAFREILKRLRDAWLDGEVSNDIQENLLLKQIIDEGNHDSTK